MRLRRKSKLTYEVPPLSGFAAMADVMAQLNGRRGYVYWKLACRESLLASHSRRRRSR